MRYKEFANLPVLDAVILVAEDGTVELREGRNWVSGRFDRNIGIDQPSHGVGQKHAHVYGRRGNEIVIVNLDGTASHGTKGRLHKDDATALQKRGFDVKAGQIIEWFTIENPPQLLLG
jgi:hypothetical protein